jgi:dolichol-phosphate mannosyltransferase
MASNAFVSVIVPFYNEAGQVQHSLEVIDGVLQKEDIRFEILAVDDGSSDATWEELLSYSVTHEHIRLLRFSRNFGKEAAICAGLDEAKGEAVIVMDGDLQHPPRYIPEMIRLWQEGYEVVEGVKEKRQDAHFLSRVAANLFYFIFRRMSGIQLKDASDFKLLDRKVVDYWKTIPERETFFRALSVWMGFRRTHFYFQVDARAVGKSKWGFRKLFRLSLNALTGFSSRPLMLISSMGTLFLFIFFILAIQTLVNYIRGVAATGFTTVILLQLLIGSIILISLGLIGMYIDSLFREVKARPRYFISEKVEGPSQEGK